MILKRGDFYRHYNNGQLQLENDSVNAFPKPSGALCRVHRVGDTSSLINGEYRFVNSELSQYLSERGIVGEVLIHHLTNSRNVPKWLTYHHHHTAFDVWSKEIKIYTFGQVPTTAGPIPIETLNPMMIKVAQIRDVIDTLSNESNFDGLLIDTKTLDGPQRYFMVPTRYCDGMINAVTHEGERAKLIVDIEHNGDIYTTAVVSMTNTIQRQIEEDQNNVLGKRVKIQYTTFVPGDRLRNFSSPVGLYMIDNQGA